MYKNYKWMGLAPKSFNAAAQVLSHNPCRPWPGCAHTHFQLEESDGFFRVAVVYKDKPILYYYKSATTIPTYFYTESAVTLRINTILQHITGKPQLMAGGKELWGNITKGPNGYIVDKTVVLLRQVNTGGPMKLFSGFIDLKTGLLSVIPMSQFELGVD